jgi:hypothetical protein
MALKHATDTRPPRENRSGGVGGRGGSSRRSVRVSVRGAASSADLGGSSKYTRAIRVD